MTAMSFQGQETPYTRRNGLQRIAWPHLNVREARKRYKIIAKRNVVPPITEASASNVFWELWQNSSKHEAMFTYQDAPVDAWNNRLVFFSSLIRLIYCLFCSKGPMARGPQKSGFGHDTRFGSTWLSWGASSM